MYCCSVLSNTKLIQQQQRIQQRCENILHSGKRPDPKMTATMLVFTVRPHETWNSKLGKVWCPKLPEKRTQADGLIEILHNLHFPSCTRSKWRFSEFDWCFLFNEQTKARGKIKKFLQFSFYSRQVIGTDRLTKIRIPWRVVINPKTYWSQNKKSPFIYSPVLKFWLRRISGDLISVRR